MAVFAVRVRDFEELHAEFVRSLEDRAKTLESASLFSRTAKAGLALAETAKELRSMAAMWREMVINRPDTTTAEDVAAIILAAGLDMDAVAAAVMAGRAKQQEMME